MKHQSVKKKERLVQAVQQGYGIEIASLEFLLRGWGGDCFQVVASGGERYFLKLHDDAGYMGIAITSRPFYLPLMDQLHSKNILPRIPHPVPTRGGDFSLAMGTHEIVMTNWIEGELVGFGELPAPILERLAKLVGILHGSRSRLEFEHPFVERFEFDFASDLSRAVATLETVPANRSLGIQTLKETVLPHREAILNGLQCLRKLQQKIRSLDKPMVICHTDLHGGNLMTGAQGNLYILDWENALIAPPEHDMILIIFAAGENFWNVFWPEYARHFAGHSLDGDLLRFYFYRRTLEDIAGFVFRILQANGGDVRDQEDIKWLRGNLKDLVHIDKNVAAIEDELTAR